MIYEPAEDSFLLQKHIKDYSRGLVLDMGTGSGIQAIEAAKHADKVIAVDMNPEAIEHCKAHIENIEWRVSDLFEDVPESFDLIIFNPPYLPEDEDEPEDSKLATTGGKKGYETIEAFLNQAGKHLKQDGVILLLFSTLSGVDKINRIILKNNLFFREIGRQKLFFEEIILYEISRMQNFK